MWEVGSQPIDARILRVLVGLDGRLHRPGVVAGCLAAARLCTLVVSGHLMSVEGRASPSDTQRPPRDDAAELLANIKSHPDRPWAFWFWRTGAAPSRTYPQLVCQLQKDGVWSAAPAATWWRPRRSGWFVDCAALEVQADTVALQAAEHADAIDGRDAITLELLVVSRARTWIPLTPPPAADFLANAHDLALAHRMACRDIVDSLIDVLYTATRDGGTANPIGNG